MGGSKRFGSPRGLPSQIRLRGKRSMEIRIDEIKADFEAYAYRDDLDGETVKRYQQIIDDLPPVDVFNTEEGLILAGGYHRLEAHRQERRETITANIHQGTVFEAKMFACKANAQHGLNMTASERKRALMDFIKFSLAEDPLLSNVAVARNFGGTSEKTVRRYRKKLEESGDIERLTERRGADGKVYQTESIGQSGSAPAEAIDKAILARLNEMLDEDDDFYTASLFCDYRTSEKRDLVKDCPSCQQPFPNWDRGQISRKDNETEVCRKCGKTEFLEDWVHGVNRDSAYWAKVYEWSDNVMQMHKRGDLL